MVLDMRGLRQRIDRHENVAFDEVSDLLAGSHDERATALWELAQSRLRVALDRLVEAANLTEYADAKILELFNALLPLGDNPWSAIRIMRDIGFHCASNGHVELALQHFEAAYVRADALTNDGFTARARLAMGYFHDEAVERAIESLAKSFVPVTVAPKSATPLRCLIVMTMILDENAPALVVRAWARGLRRLGWDVTLATTVSLESQSQGAIFTSLQNEGFPIVIAGGETRVERLQSLLDYCRANPFHLAYYAPFPVDTVTKLAACVGLARAQVFHNFAYEPYVGKYDFIANGNAPEQETHTLWPGKSRYLGSLVAMAPELDAAVPFDRTSIGIPADALMVGTYGRMVKCISEQYIGGLSKILQAVPNAYAVLAGPITQDQVTLLRDAFAQNGVLDRVKILGSRPDQAVSLVKGTDVYCDTYPFPGGQTILDAMYLGVPIVATHKIVDTNLDPSGFGSTSTIAESLLGSVVELADPADPESYARIGIAYLRDPDRRRAVGELLRASTRERFPHEGHMRKLDALFREAVEMKFDIIAAAGP